MWSIRPILSIPIRWQTIIYIEISVLRYQQKPGCLTSPPRRPGYIPTAAGWLYLTIIMDLYDRKVIGWSLSESMKAAETTIPAWQMALKNRPITGDIVRFPLG